MPLLGPAAMLLTFDVAPDAIAEHDDWHTHEHLPERLSIPGFLRGTRWVALEGGPRYVVLYEVADLSTLTSPAYLERLNNPTPWTSKMMPHYRGMTRGLCKVVGSFGLGFGHVASLRRIRCDLGEMAKLVTHPGVCSAHLLERAATAEMTNEQRLRGADAGMDMALFVTGYRVEALAEGRYRLDYSLSNAELAR